MKTWVQFVISVICFLSAGNAWAEESEVTVRPGLRCELRFIYSVPTEEVEILVSHPEERPLTNEIAKRLLAGDSIDGFLVRRMDLRDSSARDSTGVLREQWVYWSANRNIFLRYMAIAESAPAFYVEAGSGSGYVRHVHRYASGWSDALDTHRVQFSRAESRQVVDIELQSFSANAWLVTLSRTDVGAQRGLTYSAEPDARVRAAFMSSQIFAPVVELSLAATIPDELRERSVAADMAQILDHLSVACVRSEEPTVSWP